MPRKRITERAQKHLIDIRRFTAAQWGREQAVKYMNEIREKMDLLAQRPHIGVDCSKELGQGMRVCLVGSHAIYYEYDKETLIVDAVLHQSMLPDLD
jgi:toxin ParE1/3/4